MDILTLQNLLNKDTVFSANKLITDEILENIDKCILDTNTEISEETFGVYKKFVNMKQEAPEGMKRDLFTAMKNYLREKIQNKEYSDALLMNRFLIVKSELEPQSYYDIAETLLYCGNKELVVLFLDFYKKKEANLPLKLLTIANFYNFQLKDYKSAIKSYEQYLKIEDSKPVIYTTLGNLYKKEYGDESLREQNYYFEKAYNLKPDDRLALHALAFNYEKLGDKNNADKYYRELLKNNPTSTDYYNYGGFLISCGDLYNGHKYLTHRFDINDINLQYPPSLAGDKKWDFKTDISQKTLLVHYEQGFGDTIMYCRFVPELQKYCKKVIFVVQDELFYLIQNSGKISKGIEILPAGIGFSSDCYDYSTALLDVPYILKISAENIPFAQGYLEADKRKTREFKDKYIKKSDNLKVGLAYQGSKNANYKGRDIELSKFSKLFELNNIDFYSFNMENENDDRITNLGYTFNDFSDTACGLKNMDIVISTDNVILNLAGALGVETLGLFNKYPNFRWYKLQGDDTGYYKTVKPLQAEGENLWLPVMSQVINILKSKTKKYI